MKPVRKLRLLATPAATSLVSIGGTISIEGLDPIVKNNITSLKQLKYKAEVVQVVDVAIGSYTPVASTKYTVVIGDPARQRNGARDSFRRYHYTTPSDITILGATAALQREAIHGKIINQINQDSGNFVSAATKTLGAGIRITDDSGYYPVRNPNALNGRLGASRVFVESNTDGSGWISSFDGGSGANDALITSAVYAFGVGADLLAAKPVFDPMHGNIISGNYEAPKTVTGAFATSGQKYDAFVISSLIEVPAHSVGGQLAHQIQEQVIYADNGTGTSTAQLSGYLAFEREMLKLMTDIYARDARTLRDFFDTPILFQGAAGAVPTTTGANKMFSSYGGMVYTQIGTNTITVPTPDPAGLILDQDLTDTEGAEYVPATTLQNQKKFVVGNQAFSVFARIKETDVTGTNVKIGFRTEGAHNATFTSYTNLAAVGNTGALIYTHGNLAGAGAVSTNTTIVPSNATYFDLEVRVAVDGTVTCLYNNVSYPVYSVGTTALVFAAGTVLVPFLRAVNIGGGTPVAIANMFFAVGDDAWRI